MMMTYTLDHCPSSKSPKLRAGEDEESEQKREQLRAGEGELMNGADKVRAGEGEMMNGAEKLRAGEGEMEKTMNRASF